MTINRRCQLPTAFGTPSDEFLGGFLSQAVKNRFAQGRRTVDELKRRLRASRPDNCCPNCHSSGSSLAYELLRDRYRFHVGWSDTHSVRQRPKVRAGRGVQREEGVQGKRGNLVAAHRRDRDIRLLVLISVQNGLAHLPLAVVANGPVVKSYALSPGRINEPQWIVPDIAVQIPALRVLLPLVSERDIRTRKPPLRPRKVPCPEVIEARLRIPFLAGELKST